MLFLLFLVSALGDALSAPSELIKAEIIGGKIANQSLFKYQVSLELNERHRCGGTLLLPNIVISAAHCMYYGNLSEYRVRLGSANRESGGVLRDIEKFITPSDHRRIHDVVILKLVDSVVLGETIGTLPLASLEPTGNTQALISGWGLTQENGNYSDVLLFAKVIIFDKKYCENYVGSSTSLICAGRKEGGVDSCQGDSGGPLVYNGQLVGIISRGYGCGRVGHPGLNVNVAALRNWIDASIKVILREGPRT